MKVTPATRFVALMMVALLILSIGAGAFSALL